ncbi:MAG: cell division protein ZipA C-terminal FtsZ-binding domain-containing protein [Betaproteobacteria bacterium]
MRVSSLQLGLIVAGVLLVVGVLIYNAWQERRIKRRIAQAFRAPDNSLQHVTAGTRVEPTMRPAQGDEPDADPDPDAGTDAAMMRASRLAIPPEDDATWSPPVEIIEHDPEAGDVLETASDAVATRIAPAAASAGAQPDRDIECMVVLQPAKPLAAGALAAGLHARVGKRLRWFGRAAPGSPWVLLNAGTPGEFVELSACMLLADRNGAASHAQLETFVRVMSDLAPMLPAALSVPDVASEADRAEALDRLCADVDVQVGLTILKEDPASIAGTRLRGVAEAAGFRLAPGGRFEWTQDDIGAVLYTMQNVRNEPFTVDTLRTSATNGVVLVLDVPRVADPLRAFDHMKLAAKRIAHTLDGELVDDNRRPLDDAALAAIRKQVQSAADALLACRIDPGSLRAHALFGA